MILWTVFFLQLMLLIFLHLADKFIEVSEFHYISTGISYFKSFPHLYPYFIFFLLSSLTISSSIMDPVIAANNTIVIDEQIYDKRKRAHFQSMFAVCYFMFALLKSL